MARLPRRERKHAKRLCEDALLNEEGLRLSLEEGQILNNYRVSKQTLAQLVDERLVRREARLNSYYYELSHDRLAQAVLESRAWHMPRRFRVGLGIAAVVALGFLFAFAWALEAWDEAKTARDEAERARNEAEAARDEMNRLTARIIFEHAEELRRIGRLYLFEALASQIEESYLARDSAKLTDEDWNALAAMKSTLGNISASRGHSKEAEGHYNYSVETWDSLSADRPELTVYRKNLALALEGRGQIRMKLGDRDGARADFNEQHEILAGLVSGDPKNAIWQSGLAWSHIHIGDLLEQDGHLEDAMREYQAAREIFRDQTQLNPHLQADLGAAEERVGMIHLARLELGEALDAYKTLLGIFQGLSENNPDEVLWRRNVLVSHFRLGDVHTAGLDQMNSLMSYDAAHAAATRRPRNEAYGPSPYADQAKAREHREQAAEAYQAATDLAEELVKIDPENVEWQQDLAACYLALGRMAEGDGELDVVQHRYDAAREVARSLEAQNPDDVDTLRVLVDAELAAARLYIRQGGAAQGREAFEQARGSAQKAAEATGNENRWRAYLAASADGLGDAHLAESRFEDARALYDQAIEIRDELAAGAPDHVLWHIDLAVSLYKRASVDAIMAQPADSAPMRRARAILDRLEKEGRLPVFAQSLLDRVAEGGRRQ